MDVEGDNIRGCPSSIGVRGRWVGGVGSVVGVEGVDVVTCGSNWHWEGCGGRCRVDGR